MWLTPLFPEASAEVFEPPPPEPIWDWADHTVWLESKEAAEPGFYRSNKTRWTRRLQEVARDQRMFVVDYSDWQNPRWVVIPVGEFNAKKSSQSGYTEALLNIMRWRAKYRPCNMIYTIDTREEARNIIERLLPTLRKIDADIFSEDENDIGALTLRLLRMVIWFNGSFSMGKFANKQAGLLGNDELEEHKRSKKDTSVARAQASRKKTVEAGLQVNLSKPRRKGGPICKCFDRGNREEFFIQCPTCSEWQYLTFFNEEREVPFSFAKEDVGIVEIDGLRAMLPRPLPLGEMRKLKTGRVDFEHCRNHLGQWDELKVLREARHECGHCKAVIPTELKPALIEKAEWMPTHVGTPGIISQHINDLYSEDAASSVGQITLDFLNSNAEGRLELQGVYNHRFGLEHREEASKTEEDDIKANIAGKEGDAVLAYRKGSCPFVPHSLILGSDIGGNYAKWSVLAVCPNMEDVAVIDWGSELDPDDIADLMLFHTWPCGPEGKRVKLSFGFMDTKYRKKDCFRACLKVPGFRLIPTIGHGGPSRTTPLWSYNHVPTYPAKFKRIVFNDREAKNDLYIDSINKKRNRVFFPVDVMTDKEFVAELTAEKLILEEDGSFEWDEEPGPNHYGDTVKDGLLGLRFLTRKNRKKEDPQGEKVEEK